MRIHDHLANTSIYARLNAKATDRALQANADRLCGLVQGVDVLPALTTDREISALTNGTHTAR